MKKYIMIGILFAFPFLPVGRRTGESHLCEDNEP